MQSPAGTPSTPLFRNEAIRYQASRLQGEVILKIRSPWLVVGFTCAALALAMLVAAAFITHDRKVQATGALVFSEGTVRLTSPRAARVEQILARDGERVVEGQRLVTLADAQGAPLATLLAPRDLTVAVIHVIPGEDVAPGQALVELLPQRGHLEAQLRIAPTVVAQVEPGQVVNLRFDAVGERAPAGDQGRIASISLLPAADGFYRARVVLEGGPENRDALRPGMSLTGEIVIERQSLLESLFAPLKAPRQGT